MPASPVIRLGSLEPRDPLLTRLSGDHAGKSISGFIGVDLTVPALARRAGMSPRSLARNFRVETGRTPAAFVQSLQLEAARRLLETSDLIVASLRDRDRHRPAEGGQARDRVLADSFSRRGG